MILGSRILLFEQLWAVKTSMHARQKSNEINLRKEMIKNPTFLSQHLYNNFSDPLESITFDGTQHA